MKLVTDFINSFGITGENVRVSRLKDMIHVKMPLKVANEMLQTEFAMFRSQTERQVILPRITQPYYLPEEIAAKVSLVDDILRFPSINQPIMAYGAEETTDDSSAFSSCGTRCSGFTTPAVLQSAYGYSTLTESTTGNSVSVAEFQYQYYDNKDLITFSSSCGVTVEVDTTIGGNVEQICEAGGCVEALLDIEYIAAITSPVPLTVIYSSSFSLLNWIDQVIAMDEPPLGACVRNGIRMTFIDVYRRLYSVHTTYHP